jgi:hypothetical protein
MEIIIGALVALIVLKFAWSVIFQQDKYDNNGNYKD